MGVEKKHKDRLFNFIFGREEHKDWTLSLYNAVNGSDYTDPELVDFNTLEGILYLGMNNDTSFLISDIMNSMVQEPVALARARFDALSASVPRDISQHIIRTCH